MSELQASPDLHDAIKQMAWYVNRDDRLIFIACFKRILNEIRTGVAEGPYMPDIDHAIAYCRTVTRSNIPCNLEELIVKEVA